MALRLRPLSASRLVVRAQNKLQEKPKTEAKKKSKTDEIMESMQKSGIDRATAKKILAVWEQTGATNPEALRKLLVGRSLQRVGGTLVQLLLDVGAAWGGFSTGAALSGTDAFLGKTVLQYGAYFLGSYFTIGVFFDLFTLGVLGAAAVQYSTNTEAFLGAVQALAGERSGINVVDKVAQTVNTLKVASALNAIADLLKERLGEERSAKGTLANLSAYLTLARAEERGFDPAAYGLSEGQAGDIAVIFARYDENDDMRLEMAELRRLCIENTQDLSDEEIQEAMRLLDTDGNGAVDFPEFVRWWVNKVDAEAAKK